MGPDIARLKRAKHDVLRWAVQYTLLEYNKNEINNEIKLFIAMGYKILFIIVCNI